MDEIARFLGPRAFRNTRGCRSVVRQEFTISGKTTGLPIIMPECQKMVENQQPDGSADQAVVVEPSCATHGKLRKSPKKARGRRLKVGLGSFSHTASQTQRAFYAGARSDSKVEAFGALLQYGSS